MVGYRESIFVIMACTKQPSVFKFSFLVTFSGTQEEIYFVPPATREFVEDVVGVEGNGMG